MKVPRLRWWILGAAVVLVAALVVGPFVYIHLIEGSAPSKLALPRTSRTSSGARDGNSARDGDSGVATVASIDGAWHVGRGSRAGYRVGEVLVGQHTTAVGRTSDIAGTLVIAGGAVRTATFWVDMATVVSDQAARNAQFRGPIMDVARYPTAVLALTSPIILGRVPPTGVSARYTAAGDLTLHGETRAVHFSVTAEHTASALYLLADLDVPFERWGIKNPSIGGFVATQSHGTLEVLLRMVPGAGGALRTGSSPATGPPAGSGPVTLPRTTVPRTTVPRLHLPPP